MQLCRGERRRSGHGEGLELGQGMSRTSHTCGQLRAFCCMIGIRGPVLSKVLGRKVCGGYFWRESMLVTRQRDMDYDVCT
jgi:hypothetical protein